MKNYFANVRVEHRGIGRFPIRWNRWSPDSIIFKSNNLVKKIMPKKNILSYSTKGDRDQKTCERLGCSVRSNTAWNGQQYTTYDHDKYSAVQVKLTNTDIKKYDYVSANVDFIDYSPKFDSVGNRTNNLDILTYINSCHNPFSHTYCTKTHQWVNNPNSNPAPLEEGYRIAYGGQGEGMSMSDQDWDEFLDISKAIRMFLYEVVTPANRGDFDYNQLQELMVA